jgi:hypothetical protein
MEAGVILNGMLVSLTSRRGRSFVTDCSRAGEGLITDRELQTKYGLTAEDLQNRARDRSLVHAVQTERDRRRHSGIAAQEAAARRSNALDSGADNHGRHR